MAVKRLLGTSPDLATAWAWLCEEPVDVGCAPLCGSRTSTTPGVYFWASTCSTATHWLPDRYYVYWYSVHSKEA